jgi:aspartate ammonia-lyase
MPGKVNPVVPMGVVQAGFAVVGNDTCVAQCIQAGQLEINHYEPAVLSRVCDSMDLVQNAARLLRERCIQDLQADAAHNEALVLGSSAVASSFLTQLGYDAVSAVVRAAASNRRPFVAELERQGFLAAGDARALVRQAACVVPHGD